MCKLTSSNIPSLTKGRQPLISGSVEAMIFRYLPFASIIRVSSIDCRLGQCLLECRRLEAEM